MPQPAKLRAENFIVSRLYRREMHVNRQPGHRVLLEAHLRNKETVDDVVRPQKSLRFRGSPAPPSFPSRRRLWMRDLSDRDLAPLRRPPKHPPAPGSLLQIS